MVQLKVAYCSCYPGWICGIPVKYVGVGEKVEDLQKFDSDTFVNALFDVATDDEDEEQE